MKKLIGEFADDYGYDLDEEGQPLEEGAEGDSERAKSRDQADASSEAESSEETSEEETEERETEATPA
jgi:F-type H+-transporting ATPase subunit alpha